MTKRSRASSARWRWIRRLPPRTTTWARCTTSAAVTWMRWSTIARQSGFARATRNRTSTSRSRISSRAASRTRGPNTRGGAKDASTRRSCATKASIASPSTQRGLGDNLFFLRYAPALAAVLDFVGDVRLHPMLARGPFRRHRAAHGVPARGERDVVLSGDLPRRAGETTKVPPPLPLTADTARVSSMRERRRPWAPRRALRSRGARARPVGTIENLSRKFPSMRSAPRCASLRRWLAIQRDPAAGEIDAPRGDRRAGA